ncbi:MAG: tRNA pseudouridine(38-40) synthase TruA [Candidatus Aminicenantes bacterium]|nr:tRNA pseudouridine(38-40) synthase TruA [Candidatus Aminicenantes bacterium]
MASTYKLVVCYDGTDFHGWQRQPEKKTIQGVLEKALQKITGEKIPVIGAGRTDAGVHALGQTAHFRGNITLEAHDLFKALNANLPQAVRVLSAVKAEDGFHARKNALSKVYRYRIFNGTDISPFNIRYVLQWYGALDVKAMEKAAKLFVRTADFSAFSSNRFLYPVRKVIHSSIRRQGKEIIYTVEATGFLRYMVRSMAGTLIEIGRGKEKPDLIDFLFETKKRTTSSPTAPAKGLCLMKVNYQA